jgi:uncharacterized membrane protein
MATPLFAWGRAGVVTIALLTGARAAATTYTFVPIDVPGVNDTTAMGINDAGDIVGTVLDAGGFHGFLLSEGVYTTFDTGYWTFGSAINDAGQIVGWYEEQSSSQAFLLEDGLYSVVPPFSGSDIYAEARGIDDSGRIIVTRSLAPPLQFRRESFLSEGGTFSVVSAPGATNTLLAGINDAGDIVGTSDAAGLQRFLLRNGVFMPLDLPGDPVGINDSGQILGDNFLWSGGVVEPLPFGGARGINDAGWIVGHGFLALPVPEPSAVLLGAVVAVALASAGPNRSRRRE